MFEEEEAHGEDSAGEKDDDDDNESEGEGESQPLIAQERS